MSFQALHAAWMTTVGDASAQLVLFALAGHHNDETGQCNPSQATLARRTGLSVDTVGRAVKRLCEDGHITRKVNRDPVTRQRYSDSYRLLFASPRRMAEMLMKQALEEESQEQPGNLQGGAGFFPGIPGASPQVADTPTRTMRPPSPHSADETRKGIIDKPGPKAPGATKAQIEGLWALIPDQRATRDQPHLVDLRKRSESKAVVGNALSARLRDGHSYDRIVQGVRAYYQDPDIQKTGDKGPWSYAAGLQRVLTKGLWETYLEAQAPEETDDDDLFAARQAPGGPARTAPVDLVADWQGRAWLAEWLEDPGAWLLSRGPQPGQAGCRIDPDLMRAHGVTPWGDGAEGDPTT